MIERKQFELDPFVTSAESYWQMPLSEVEKLLGQCGHWSHMDLTRGYWDGIDRATLLRPHFLRDIWIDKFGFSIPCKEMIDAVVAYSKNSAGILDPMCGTGWLAAQMRKAGINVVASDDGSWAKFKSGEWKSEDLLQMDAVEAVKQHPSHTVLLSWPYMDDGALHVAQAMKPGQMLVYIGEGNNGACATDDFFELLEAEFDVIASFEIPTFYCIRDFGCVYGKRHG